MESVINNCGCGGRGHHLSQNGCSVYCLICKMETDKYFSMSEAIEAWNKANPKLTNAQQAVQWLESGKKITANIDGSDYIVRGMDNKIYSNYKGSHAMIDFSNFWEQLFFREWKIYEEKEYTLSFEEAMQNFIEGKMSVTNIDGEEYYIDYINITHIELKRVNSHEEIHIKKPNNKYNYLHTIKWRVQEYQE